MLNNGGMNTTDNNRQPPSLLVASPVYNDQCYGSYTNSLLMLQAELYKRNIGFEYAWTKSSSLITIARNLLTAWFLNKTNCTHLLFIDSDMVFRSADVLAMIDQDKDIIAAICPRKEINWPNVAAAARQDIELPARDLSKLVGSYGTFRLLNPDEPVVLDKPVEVTGIGTGIMLIKRRVFEVMAEAYPDAVTRSHDATFGGQQIHTFFDLGRDDQGNMLSEDIAFCKRWRDIGGKVYGAPWFEVGHIGSYEFRGSLAEIASMGGSI
jgi:hypothetical protein